MCAFCQLDDGGEGLELCEDFSVFDGLVDTDNLDGKEVAPYQPTSDFKLGR